MALFRQNSFFKKVVLALLALLLISSYYFLNSGVAPGAERVLKPGDSDSQIPPATPQQHDAAKQDNAQGVADTGAAAPGTGGDSDNNSSSSNDNNSGGSGSSGGDGSINTLKAVPSKAVSSKAKAITTAAAPVIEKPTSAVVVVKSTEAAQPSPSLHVANPSTGAVSKQTGSPEGEDKGADEAEDPTKAFVFYVTRDMYACSIAVNIYRLKSMFRTKHQIIVLMAKGVTRPFRQVLENLGARIIDEEPYPLHSQSISYYEGCLLKLAAFRLHEVDSRLKRIMTLDADQIVLQSLDHVFDLPPADFMAPPSYWDNTPLSSTTMLIQPNPALWDRVRTAMEHPKPNQYDMDMINELFPDPPKLHGKYVTINSHWEDNNVPVWFETRRDDSNPPGPDNKATDKDLRDLYLQAPIVHYFAVGKPWSLTVDEVRKKKPGVHEILLEQWELWRSIAMSECPEGTIKTI